jgi:hypothetical protein
MGVVMGKPAPRGGDAGGTAVLALRGGVSMNRYAHRLVALFAAAFLMVGLAACGLIVSPLDLVRDSGSADVICVGKLLGIGFGRGPDGTPTMSATFRVDRVVKGDVRPGQQVSIEGPRARDAITGYDLVLLNRDGPRFAFAPGTRGAIPAAETVHTPYLKSNDVRMSLRWEVVNSLQDPSYPVVRAALQQVALLSADEVARYVRPLVSNADARLGAYALAACVTAGDNAMLPAALQCIAGHYEDHSYSRETEEGFGRLRAALEQAKIPVEQLPLVGRYIASASPIVRKLACYVLRMSRAPEALPYLKSALQDTDVEVRYHAVMALSRALGDFSHAAPFETYKAHESEYLDYWKAKEIKEPGK